MKQKRVFFFALVLFVVLVSLSACGSNTPAPTASSTTAPATSTTAAIANRTTESAPTASVTQSALATVTPAATNRPTTTSSGSSPTANTNATATRGASTTTTTAPATTGTSTAATAPAASGTGATMKEAYNTVDPLVKKWQADAVYVAIFNNPESTVGIAPDGRCPEWLFQAVSVKLNKRGTWLVKPDASGKPAATQTGDEDLPADMTKAQANRSLPPVTTMIDSSEVMAIARQNGGEKSDRPVGFLLTKPSKEGDPLAFNLVFVQGSKTIPLRIDALTGKVLDIARG